MNRGFEIHSRLHRLHALAFAFAACVVCGCPEDPVIIHGDAGSSSTEWISDDDAGTTDIADSGFGSMPVVVELEGIVTQEVPWAGSTVAIKAARIDRATSWFAERADLEIDVEIKNLRGYDNALSFDTCDLVLANGTRRSISNGWDTDVTIPPGDTALVMLAYDLDEETALDLRGATLLLDGDFRGELEPEVIPLDQPWTRAADSRIASLVGRTIEPTIVERSLEAVRVEFVDARYGLNDISTDSRAAISMRLVSFDVIATCVTSVHDCGFHARNIRIIAEGRTFDSTYESYGGGVFKTDAFEKAHVQFEIPASARSFSATLDTGDESSHRLEVNLDEDLTPLE